MRTQRFFWSLVAGLVLVLALQMLLDVLPSADVRAAPAATIRYVLGDGGIDCSDCSDPNDPCATVQYALEQAASGDTIRVANKFSAAVYTGPITITKSVVLEGGWNATPIPHGLTWNRPSPCEPSRTTLDAQGAGRAITILNADPVIDCFTITGGDATGLGGSGPYSSDLGGGVYGWFSDVTVANCVVTDNVASRSGIGWGGGLGFYGGHVTLSNTQVLSNVASTTGNGYGGGAFFRYGSATLIGNLVKYNVASKGWDGRGGGLAFYDEEASLRDNVVWGNTASVFHTGYGGGVVAWHSDVDLQGGRLEWNFANTGGNVGYGGGLNADFLSTITVENVTVDYNMASSGGGVYVYTSTATISGCRAYRNSADTGGGIFLYESNGATLSDSEVYSNTATYNGGGVYLWYSEGCTLTGNRVSTNTATQMGGGIAVGYSPGATLEGNEVFGNEAETGGGVNVFYSDNTTLTGNSLHDNEAAESGGGVYVLSSHGITLTGNEIHENSATDGPGVALVGSGGRLEGNRVHDNVGGEGDSGVRIDSSDPVEMTGNEISGNHGGDLGGIYIGGSTHITLTGNTVFSNVAQVEGGGLYLIGSSDVRLEANLFSHNTAYYGGGMYLRDNPGSPLLVNNVVADNRVDRSGPGIYIKGCAPILLHTTLARNTGGDGYGVYVTSGEVAMTNTILVGHAVGIHVSGDSTTTLEATLWGSDSWVNGTDWEGDGTILTGTVNIWGPPAFVDPNNGDYHIGLGSAAIDAGVEAEVTTDIDHDPRPVGAVPDIGADEYARHVYLPLVYRGSG